MSVRGHPKGYLPSGRWDVGGSLRGPSTRVVSGFCVSVTFTSVIERALVCVGSVHKRLVTSRVNTTSGPVYKGVVTVTVSTEDPSRPRGQTSRRHFRQDHFSNFNTGSRSESSKRLHFLRL